jgi:hypothetical protein
MPPLSARARWLTRWSCEPARSRGRHTARAVRSGERCAHTRRWSELHAGLKKSGCAWSDSPCSHQRLASTGHLLGAPYHARSTECGRHVHRSAPRTRSMPLRSRAGDAEVRRTLKAAVWQHVLRLLICQLERQLDSSIDPQLGFELRPYPVDLTAARAFTSSKTPCAARRWRPHRRNHRACAMRASRSHRNPPVSRVR